MQQLFIVESTHVRHPDGSLVLLSVGMSTDSVRQISLAIYDLLHNSNMTKTKITYHHFNCLQDVRWLHVNTSGSHSWDHSPSEISHGSDSQQLRSYGYLKFKMIWTLHRTSGSFMRLAASKIRWNSSSPLLILLSYTMFSLLHGNLGEWGPVTAVANFADHRDQSISQGSAHWGTPSRVFWHVGLPVMLEVHL
jgi:hypothetical protein